MVLFFLLFLNRTCICGMILILRSCVTILIFCLIVADNLVEVSVSAGQCIISIVKDGFSNRCFTQSTTASFDDQSIVRYDEIALFLMWQESGIIVDAIRYEIPRDIKARFDEESSFNVIWPKEGAVVSSNEIDFQYYHVGCKVEGGIEINSICIFVKAVNLTKCAEQGHIISMKLPNGIYEIIFYGRQLNSAYNGLSSISNHLATRLIEVRAPLLESEYNVFPRILKSFQQKGGLVLPVCRTIFLISHSRFSLR